MSQCNICVWDVLPVPEWKFCVQSYLFTEIYKKNFLKPRNIKNFFSKIPRPTYRFFSSPACCLAIYKFSFSRPIYAVHKSHVSLVVML